MLITYGTLEKFFSNFSFLILFFSMIFYWVRTGFMKREDKIKNPKSELFGTVTITLANFSLFSLLILRWKESGHFPLSNLYESLMFLSWSFTTIHLILEKVTKQKLLGCITSPSALFTNAFATFSLPLEMQKASSLVPALQSNWLMMHVTVMVLSYAALICGSLLSIAFLIITKGINSKDIIQQKNYSTLDDTKTITNLNLLGATTSPFSFLSFSDSLVSVKIEQKKEESYTKSNSQQLSEISQSSLINVNSKNKHSQKIKLAQILDNLSYRILGLGFPLLTIGILSGAVWANEAWGSYWSWDPKETWAFLTWIVFAIYLHTRLTKGWQGKKPAIIASLGFITVWICFLGVNLIGEGLHSYGWIHS